MRLDDIFNQRKAQARAFECLVYRVVNPVKFFEYARQVVFGDADAVIDDIDLKKIRSVILRADGNCAFFGSKFYGKK